MLSVYFALVSVFCLKRAFRNLGRKLENGARSLVGKDQKFNPYKRGFKNSKEVGAKLLEDVYDYNKAKKKTDRMNYELQKLASKSGIDVEDVDVNENWFKKNKDVEDDSNNVSNMSIPSPNMSDLLENLSYGDTGDSDGSCAENLIRIKQLLQSRQDYDTNEDVSDGSLGVDALQSVVSKRKNLDSIEIFPGDIVTKKEVITISRSA